ncbi:MAG: SDR family oxidoreductase [Lewinella sp.]|nr:SDR family oxidoreductase [Lewinella sp.]
MNFLITGASRGIGYDTALALAAHEAHTVLAISRNAERLEKLATTAHQRYGRNAIRVLPYDLTQPEPARLLDWVHASGPLHGLLNNAGLLINKPFRELTSADWQASFATNFFGVVELVRTLLPVLDRAHILNIGSMGGFQGSAKFPGLSAYSASKGALANLTECLAEELREEGIVVNCLALGAVQTEMLATAFPGLQAPVASEQMGRFVAYFLQEGRHFFNGKVLPVSVSTP